MHDSTKALPTATQAFWAEAPFQGPPAEAFLWNRLAPYMEALWAAAQAGDWNGFVSEAYQVYLAGLLDAGLPLAALLAVDEEEVVEDGD